MNILQGIETPTTFIVTLNPRKEIQEQHIIGKFNYSHPIFTLNGIRAQARKSEIDGVRATWFCGAYWRNGFHEDGCASGLDVAEQILARTPC